MNKHKPLLMIAMGVACLWGIPCFAASNECYHTNRVFVPVNFNIQVQADIFRLYTESSYLTCIVKGTNITIDTNATFGIERQVINLGYASATDAWNAVVNYDNWLSLYPSGISTQAGWVRGTKSTVDGEWGAYLWTLQNRMVFKSSETNWYRVCSNGVMVAITNVYVGSLGTYQPMEDVVDIGPSLNLATNDFPGADAGEERVYYADYTNVYYRLTIPAIRITPPGAVTWVGGSNLEFEVKGTNIPQGVEWSITTNGTAGEAVLVETTNSATVTPGTVASNYTLRATSIQNTNFSDAVNVAVVGVDVLTCNVQGQMGGMNMPAPPGLVAMGTGRWILVKAFPIPTNAPWPAGKPVWTNVSHSYGDWADFTPTTAGVYSISAECGNTVTGLVAAVKMEVTNIVFNWNTGASTNDALNIRKDYTTPYNITSGEWVKGATNIPACYTTNKAVAIKARFVVQPASITSAIIWAVSTATGGSLSNVMKTNVMFSGGVSDYVEFQLEGTTPDRIKKTTSDVWQWEAEEINGSGAPALNLNTSGPHTVYTILNEPVAPWTNTVGNVLNVWTRILDRSCLWANGCVTASTVLSNIVTQSYSMANVVYDGGAHHTGPGYTQFHLQLLLEHLDEPGIDEMDCRDFANWTHTLSGSVGESAQYRVVTRTNSPSYFTYNYILPAGASDWVTGNWNFHQVGWWNSGVCDAAAKLDNDADPTQGPGNSNHVEKLAVGDMTQTNYLDKLTETPNVTDIETGTCVLD